MAKIIEILDSENIKNTFNNWFNECEKFRKWHLKMGPHEIDDLQMEKAYLKIHPKYKYVDKIAKILNHD